jgi:hypothetical protein
LMSLVGTAVAEDKIYIMGNRSVYMTISAESAGQNPVIIDCSKKTNSDPIGCIIAASSKLASEKKVEHDINRNQLVSR